MAQIRFSAAADGPFGIKRNTTGYGNDDLTRNMTGYGNDDLARPYASTLQSLLQERAALPPEQQAIWDADPKNIDRIATARRMEAGLPPNSATPPAAAVNAPPANPFTPKPQTQGTPYYATPRLSGPLNHATGEPLFAPPIDPIPRPTRMTLEEARYAVDPNPYPRMQRFKGDTMFSNPTGQILTNSAGETFDRNLLASIAEVISNGTPEDARRARAVLGAASNPSSGGFVNAGARYDREQEILRFKEADRLARLALEEANADEEDPLTMLTRYAKGSFPQAGAVPPVSQFYRPATAPNPFRRAAIMPESMGTNPFIRLDPNENQAINGQRGGIGIPVRTYIAPDPRYQTPDWAGSTARPMIGPPQMGRQYPDPYAVPVPLSPPGAPRRSVAPIGDAFSTTPNLFMRGGVASPVNPFVRRFAEGTDWLSQRSPAYQAAYRQYMTANPNRGDFNARRAGENAERVEIYGRNMRAKPTGVVNPPRTKSTRRPSPPVVTGPRIPNGWRAIGTGGTSYDLEKYKNWAQLMGYDWREVANEDEYLQSIGVLPKKDGDVWKDNPPADKTPVVEKPRLNPQVIWYDGDVWKNLPSLNALNNTQQINPFSRLGSRSSYDPATETTIQAPEKMNAFTMQQIDRDPQQLDVMKSIYDRHGRNWEKEYGDAIRAAPMGNATRYVKTG